MVRPCCLPDKGAIVTVDDRKSKLPFAAPLPGKKAKYVKEVMVTLFSPIKKLVETVIFDNWEEFTLHEDIAKEIGCDTSFAKPYHSWERGENENANGLLRQYFPKAPELIDITMKKVVEAIGKLNSRPRECLNFKSPYEAFGKLTGLNVRKVMGYALIT